MKKPIIEVKCDMDSEDTLVFQHEPCDAKPDIVWVKTKNAEVFHYIQMSRERALALGKALVETYGNDEAPEKITI